MPPMAAGHAAVSYVMPMGAFRCLVDKIVMIVARNLHAVLMTVQPGSEQGSWCNDREVSATEVGLLAGIGLPPMCDSYDMSCDGSRRRQYFHFGLM